MIVKTSQTPTSKTQDRTELNFQTGQTGFANTMQVQLQLQLIFTKGNAFFCRKMGYHQSQS